MKNSNDDAADHLTAKITVYFFYILIGVASIEMSNPYIALVLGTAVWLFGINSVAYCVETIRGHAHRHHVV